MIVTRARVAADVIGENPNLCNICFEKALASATPSQPA
jgi:hypothetical protein